MVFGIRDFFFPLWFLFVCLHFFVVLLVWVFFQRLKPEELCDMHDLPGR